MLTQPMNWNISKFDQLTTRQLYEILRLRGDVFVYEQKCAYPDVDDYDLHAFHLTAWDGNILAGYARILPPASKYPQASIGRVAVRADYRGRGLARELVQQSLDCIAQYFPGQPAFAQSQCYLETFYQSFGFAAIGAPYDDEGIPHVDMIRAA